MVRRLPVEMNTAATDVVDGRHIREVTFQRVRVEYVGGVLERTGQRGRGQVRVLVVGSARGELSRALASAGFEVTAVDPSAAATEMARERSAREGAGITHAVGHPEELEAADASFDIVYCADTFEITERLDKVLAEAARVLTAGGTLLYDTVNRTPLSRLVYLGAFQRIPFTRIMPSGRYTARRLRTPAELSRAMADNGLRNEDVCAFQPTSVLSLVKAVLARKRGAIGDEDLPSAVTFTLAPAHRPLVTYLGHARKR